MPSKRARASDEFCASDAQADPFKPFQNALDVLQKENIRNYQDKDRKYLEKVEKLMQHKQSGVNEIEIKFHCDNERKRKTYQSADMPQATDRSNKHKISVAYDTVKGEMKMVDLRGGKSKCMIIPVFPGIPRVECEFSDEMFEGIQKNLGKMVAVYGECWSHSGEAFPHKMRVDRMKRLPKLDEDTGLYDIQGIYPDLGGDKPSEQIVWEMRDEWDD